MAAEQNLSKSGDLAKVQSIDFAEKFGENISKLIEALGITRKIAMTSGMLIKTYTSKVTLADGNVEEGELIPLSKVETKPGPTVEIKLKKYRKATSAEAIQAHGFDQAINGTDSKLIRELQKGIRKTLFDFLGTGTGSATGVGLQGALAQAWGQIQVLFEDDAADTIAFAHPLDVADYTGTAGISTQTVFGMTFVTGFTDTVVITNTNVPRGKLLATAAENVVLAYVPVKGSEIAKAFDFTSDQTGLIGITHQQAYGNLTFETILMSGLTLFAERLDGVVQVTIGGTPEGQASPMNLNLGSNEGSNGDEANSGTAEYTEAKLKKLNKTELAAIIAERKIEGVAEDATAAVMITKILEAQEAAKA